LKELLEKCHELGITKCKSKNKNELLLLIKDFDKINLINQDNCSVNGCENDELQKEEFDYKLINFPKKYASLYSCMEIYYIIITTYGCYY
jgi:hypothetical protein